MFYVNLHEFKPTQAMDCINLNMIIHKYELLPGLIGAEFADKANEFAQLTSDEELKTEITELLTSLKSA
ncbi:MAG: hypothetical protein HRT38_16980 [Alteromonadaceae bacterium]|nr:hypothetical protein [Alteromonadaceae bacterium]